MRTTRRTRKSGSAVAFVKRSHRHRLFVSFPLAVTFCQTSARSSGSAMLACLHFFSLPAPRQRPARSDAILHSDLEAGSKGVRQRACASRLVEHTDVSMLAACCENVNNKERRTTSTSTAMSRLMSSSRRAWSADRQRLSMQLGADCDLNDNRM